MKKLRIKILKISTVFFVAIILLSNYWIVGNWFFAGLFNEGWNEYMTSNGEFRASEFSGDKGMDFQRVQRMYVEFLKEHPNTTDTILYRTTPINPLKFWNWHEYIFNKGYRLPYRNPEEIKEE